MASRGFSHYKYRLYPTRKQTQTLHWTVNECRELYNAALQERRDAWNICRHCVSCYDQSAQLVPLKQHFPELTNIHAQVLQNVVRRVDRTYSDFFRRGHGFPRFKGRHQYDSFTYPQTGFSIKQGKLALNKIGHIRIKLHREPKGRIKNLTIKREGDRWYAIFVIEHHPELIPANSNAIGIDVGLESFLTVSDGELVDNPRWLKQQEVFLRRANRAVSRKKKFGSHWKKAVKAVANIHRKIANQRRDFHHKLSRQMVNVNGTIVVEHLNVKGLAQTRVSKSVNDVGWSTFINMLAYKAESAGRKLIFVNPRGTSQRCPCGASVPKKLSERKHECESCGLRTTRDHAAAMEILRLGLSLQALNMGSKTCLSEKPERA